MNTTLKKYKYIEPRATLKESLETAIEFSTVEELCEIIKSSFVPHNNRLNVEIVDFENMGIDYSCGWEIYCIFCFIGGSNIKSAMGYANGIPNNFIFSK